MSDSTDFVPNGQILTELLSMGIENYVAEAALYNTGNESCDAAVAYIFDSADRSGPQRVRSRKASRRAKANARKAAKNDEDDDEGSDERTEPLYKMVFVVNGALEMSTGKIASQVAHGCLGLYKSMLYNEETPYEDVLENWERLGEKKVVLKGNSQVHLVDLQANANLMDMPTHIVQDAGLTEVAAGSITILALFGKQLLIDEITGDLPLL